MPTRSNHLTPHVGRGMHDKHQVIEEPDEEKPSCRVLSARQGGNSLSLASAWARPPALLKQGSVRVEVTLRRIESGY